MIVISDTSPLLTLWSIGELSVLPKLFGEIVIPPDVETEIRAEGHGDSADAIFDECGDWLTVRTPLIVLPIRGLDPGETSAIALAKELAAQFLIIDERLGRKAAMLENVSTIGTVGVLERAANAGLIDLAVAFERIKQGKFRVTHEFLDRRLEAHRTNRTTNSNDRPASDQPT